MEQEFLTGKCPKCMQELRVPASLAEFSCMYCGARLAQSDLVTEAAETPAAPDADAYAAALEAEKPETLRGAYELLHNLDNYQRIVDTYDYGRRRLQETLGLDDDAIYELDGYMDFEKYGADCMENDHVIETGFGRLRRLDPPFPEQTQGQQMFR